MQLLVYEMSMNCWIQDNQKDTVMQVYLRIKLSSLTDTSPKTEAFSYAVNYFSEWYFFSEKIP